MISSVVVGSDDARTTARKMVTTTNPSTVSRKEISCSCICHSSSTHDDNGTRMSPPQRHGTDETTTPTVAQQKQQRRLRPTMEVLHQLIQNRQWDQVQHALQLDASVAMRIDGSFQEDYWVHETRRRQWWRRLVRQEKQQDRRAADYGTEEEELGHLFAQMKMKYKIEATISAEDNPPPMQLRYWVGNGNHSFNHNNDNNQVYKLRRMTLLHSLCRLKFFSSQDSEEHDETTNGDDLLNAVQTAEMIISASHNELLGCCIECPCHFCPPMFLPEVSHGDDDDEDDIEDGAGARKDVLHTSVLTMTDKMGDTPLHLLTCAGSHHIELIKALFRGCALSEYSNESNYTNEIYRIWRRPTVYDLLTAPNDHGSTPLHFLSECDRTDENVLRYVLEQCPLSLHCDDDGMSRAHPSMVADNEGDLPLHYALSNCAPPSCLTILTTLGDNRSALIPNSQHKLPIDVLIEWYNDNLNDFYGEDNIESNQREEDGDDDIDSDESDDSGSSDSHQAEVTASRKDERSEEAETTVGGANESGQEEDIVRGGAFLRRNHLSQFFLSFDLPGRCYMCPGVSLALASQGLHSGGSRNGDFWESDLWQQMIVLVDAAASAIISANRTVPTEQNGADSSRLRSNPVHTAVIATKYGNFPAFALTMATPLDRNLTNEMAASYFLGYLPLHWACGDISYLLNSNYSHQTKYQDHKNPNTRQYTDMVRFNTNKLAVTMIQYLLYLCPEAASIATSRHGELPLHLFLQDKRVLWNHISRENLARAYVEEIPFGMLRWYCSPDLPRCTPWDEIKSLLTACPEALSTPSMANHLYPFQLAATASDCSSSDRQEDEDAEMREKTRLLSLENTYRLLLEDPSVVDMNS